jgi:hypothetical protein
MNMHLWLESTDFPLVRFYQERFCDHLEEVGPISWREELVDFKPINDV